MKRGRKAGHTSTAESFAIVNGKPGDWFYTEKADKDITAIASYHKRLVMTERCLIVHHNLVPPQTTTITKVVLLGWKEEKVEEEPTEQIGEYRYLEAGETIQEGDEEQIWPGRWEVNTNDIGNILGPMAAQDKLLRRKIPAEPRYRPFVEGDVIERTDEWRKRRDEEVGQWGNISISIGELVKPTMIGHLDFRKLIK